MKCRHRPNAVLIEICEPVLGNWPQSVLGKEGCSPLGPGTIKEHKTTYRYLFPWAACHGIDPALVDGHFPTTPSFARKWPFRS